MRTATTAVDRMPLLRAALLGSGLAAAWVVVSLVSGPSSASAEEDPSGLLGTVGSVVGVVDDTVDAVGDEVVEPVVTAVVTPAVEPVAATVETVDEAAPAPLQPVVDAVPVIVETATDAAAGTLHAVDAVTTDTVAEVGGLVGDVAGGAPVGGIADPLVGVVDHVVGSLPILGPVLGDDTLGGLLGPVVGAVDDTLGTVVGDLGPLPGDGLLPSLPDHDVVPSAPGLDQPNGLAPAGDDAVTEPVSAAAPAATPGGAATDSNPGMPGDPVSTAPLGAIAPSSGAPGDGPDTPLGTSAPAGGSSAGGSGPGGVAGSDATSAAHDLDALASLVLHMVDDALPSSPVYDTDTTPD